MTDSTRASSIVRDEYKTSLRALIALLLILPVFMTLESGLFRSEEFLYNSHGLLNKLPVPLSVFTCFLGIILLGNFRRANSALAVIFLFFVLMVLSAVVMSSGSPSEEKAKLLLILQYILPMFGLVLGMLYDEPREGNYLVEKSFLIVLAALMPAQLAATWIQGHKLLTPYLYAFSVYAHLQYVPVVVASGFLISLFGLWVFPKWRVLLIAEAPILGIYLVSSGSMLAVGLVAIGSAFFALSPQVEEARNNSRVLKLMMLGLVIGSGVLCNLWTIWGSTLSETQVEFGAEVHGIYYQKITSAGLPVNLQERFDIWSYFFNELFVNTSTFLFGHGTPPDRNAWPSAHNYFLDVAYNFGLLPLLVIVGLIFFTLVRLYKRRAHVMASTALLGLALVVLFLIVPDSLMKVGLRQPYSGLFSYFLWGLLLVRIETPKHSSG